MTYLVVGLLMPSGPRAGLEPLGVGPEKIGNTGPIQEGSGVEEDQRKQGETAEENEILTTPALGRDHERLA